jgi:hypothetical protein
MADALQRFLRASRLDRGLAEHEVLAAWSQTLGPAQATRARAVRFRDGELVVEVASAALLQELSNFTGEGHRRAVNRRLGAERIQRVTFQPRR